MKIAVVGKGNVGGGLADRWEKAGHEVTRIGSEGGDVSDAEAVLLAVPGGAASNAEYVKSRTNGPTAKSFNVNFARVYDRLDDVGQRPGNLWCGDDEAREVVERLNRDAGFDPIYAGGLENAGAQEAALGLVFSINE